MSSRIHSSRNVNPESGNAVTLTLLGLAVAILAGVVVLYMVGAQRPVPVPVDESARLGSITTDDVVVNPREGWRMYEDAEYHFSFEYPDGWIVATGTILGMPVVTAYDAAQYMSTSSTFGVHELDTRLSVYPRGVPLEKYPDTEVDSGVIVPMEGVGAKDYILGSMKRPWATIARFDTRPEGWSDDGFVFMRTHIEDEMLGYVRGESEITVEEFNPTAGDKAVRQGFVNVTLRGVQEEMLRSFNFVTASNDSTAATPPTSSDVSDRIHVTLPEESDVVTSPLVIKGEARGSWYFEASFPVELRTADGEVLAEVPATALGEWMTEDFVPFEVSLVFPNTTATSGVLRLKRDNPSGIPEQDAMLDIPVLFQQEL